MKTIKIRDRAGRDMKRDSYIIILALIPLLLLVRTVESPAAEGEAAEPMGLEECLGRVFAENRIVAIADRELAISLMGIKAARSVFLPKIMFVSAYNRIDRISRFQIPLGLTPREIVIGTNNNYSANLEIQYPLFNWGRNTLTYGLAQRSSDLAGESALEERRNLYDRTVRSFYSLLLSQRVEEIQAENHEKAVALKKIADVRYSAGIVLKLDVLNADLRVTEARNNLESAREARIRAQLVLGQLVKYSPGSFPTVYGEFRSEIMEIDAETLARQATAGRIELKSIEVQEAMSELRMKLAKNELKPSLSFGAGYNFRNGYMPDFDETLNNWNAGVTLYFPIFDGLSSRYRAQEERIAQERLSLMKEETRELIELEIRQQASRISELKASRDLFAEALLQAEESARVAVIQYKNGSASMTEVLNAESALLRVKLGDAETMFRYTVALYDLEKAAGSYPGIVNEIGGGTR